MHPATSEKCTAEPSNQIPLFRNFVTREAAAQKSSTLDQEVFEWAVHSLIPATFAPNVQVDIHRGRQDVVHSSFDLQYLLQGSTRSLKRSRLI
jgi:hypothetical protein